MVALEYRLINGFKASLYTTGWQIVKTPIGHVNHIKATGKDLEETFKKFVSKCEAKGVNYRTDFNMSKMRSNQLITEDYTPVFIEGFKVTYNKKGFQIARRPLNCENCVVVNSKISPEDAFNRFVKLCENRGLNYKTDFRPLSLSSQKVAPVVTQELASIGKDSVFTQDLISNEAYGFSLKLKGATPETLRKVNHRLISLFKDQGFIGKLRDGSILNEDLTLRSSDIYLTTTYRDTASHAVLSAFGDYISDFICETFDVWFKGDYPESFRILLMTICEYYVNERTSLRMR